MAVSVTKFFSGTSVIFASSVLVLLYLRDFLWLADKSSFSVIISMFGAVEFCKYFIMTTQFPDVLKALNTSIASYSYSVPKTNSDKRRKQIFKGIILMVIVTFLYHTAIVLLGAGVVENFEETFLLSALLCVLTFLPLCLYFGSNSALGALFNAYSANVGSFEATLRQTIYITLFGAWVGAFVIPLDWDRPWQKWPIPCAVGAMSGYCISHIIKLPSPQATKFSV